MRNKNNNPQVSINEFPYDPAFPFRYMGRAVMHGLGSKAWNQFLASLPLKERTEAVKSIKAARVYEKPACYWPRESSYKRGWTHATGDAR